MTFPVNPKSHPFSINPTYGINYLRKLNQYLDTPSSDTQHARVAAFNRQHFGYSQYNINNRTVPAPPQSFNFRHRIPAPPYIDGNMDKMLSRMIEAFKQEEWKPHSVHPINKRCMTFELDSTFKAQIAQLIFAEALYQLGPNNVVEMSVATADLNSRQLIVLCNAWMTENYWNQLEWKIHEVCQQLREMIYVLYDPKHYFQHAKGLGNGFQFTIRFQSDLDFQKQHLIKAIGIYAQQYGLQPLSYLQPGENGIVTTTDITANITQLSALHTAILNDFNNNPTHHRLRRFDGSR